LAAGLVLSVAGLKAGADPSEVSADSVWMLGAVFVPCILGLWLAMMAAIAAYRLTRGEHEENLRLLAVKKSS
jgi:hypothetical protein